VSAHDDDLVRRGDVRKAFADYSSVLDDFNEELDKVPATFRVGECPVCSCTIIPGGCTAEKCRHPEMAKPAEPAKSKCSTCDGVNASWVRCPECGAGGA